MPPTKPVGQVVDKWARRASVASPDYQAGVQNPRRPWQQAAAGADANYRQAVTAAAGAGRYAAGVNAAGDQRWQTGALSKGPGRFTEGVNLGQPRYSEQAQKVLTTIQGVTLPARGPTGSPQNFQRIAPIGDALRRAFGKAGAAGAR